MLAVVAECAPVIARHKAAEIPLPSDEHVDEAENALRQLVKNIAAHHQHAFA